MSVTESFPGANNDKAVVKYDEFMQELRKGPTGKFGNIKFKLYDENGVETEETAPYVICDNGFLRWESLISPFNTVINIAQLLFAHHL